MELENILNEIEKDNSKVFKYLPYLSINAKNAVDAFNFCKEIALKEAENEQGKFEIDGNVFEKRQGAKRFDFTGIEEIERAKEHLKNLEQKYKGAYSMYERGSKAFDEATGEILEIPKVTYSKDSLIVKNG